MPKYFLPLLPYTDLVPPSTDPEPPSTNQYRPILTQHHPVSTITTLYCPSTIIYNNHYRPITYHQYHHASTSINWECCLGITDFCTVYPGSSLWYRSTLLSNCFLHCHSNQVAHNLSGRKYIEGNISKQQEQMCTPLPFLAKVVQPVLVHIKWALSWIWWITDSNYRLTLNSDSKLCKTSGNGVRKSWVC